MIDFCYENPELIRDDGKCPAHGWSCAPQEKLDASDEDVRDDLIINIAQHLDELPRVENRCLITCFLLYYSTYNM